MLCVLQSQQGRTLTDAQLYTQIGFAGSLNIPASFKFLFMNNTLPPPTTTMSEILYRMICGEKVSERDMQLNSFRSRISDLGKRYGLPIQFEWRKFSTRFNRAGMYRVHFIEESDKEKAIKVYKDLMKHRVDNDIKLLANKMKV